MAITKEINVSVEHPACDVCGRNLLRGERAEIYLDGGARRSVCDLCKSRAAHEGWVREGTEPTYDSASAQPGRRGSFLSRLRLRRDAGTFFPEADEQPSEPTPVDQTSEPPVLQPPGEPGAADEAEPKPAPPLTVRKRAREPIREPAGREPRHVHAIPIGAEQKILAAIEAFNTSEHRRTVTGVARALGPPTVSIQPNQGHPSLVDIVTSWELCWYRYEVDLSEEVPVVRVGAQGYELEELSPAERRPNATYDKPGAFGVLQPIDKHSMVDQRDRV